MWILWFLEGGFFYKKKREFDFKLRREAKERR